MIDQEKRQSEVEKWVEELKIKGGGSDPCRLYASGGNQQRIVLAKWLATNPEVLILNGPTVGVDIGSKHDMHAILHELAKSGLGIIIISDDLPRGNHELQPGTDYARRQDNRRSRPAPGHGSRPHKTGHGRCRERLRKGAKL